VKGKALCVAVSGIHLGENSQPGPGVIRSLKAAFGDEVRIVGLAYDIWDSSLHTAGELDEAFLMPYPSVGPEEYLARLAEIDSICGIDVLIPCLDVELPVLQCLKPELQALNIRCVLPTRSALLRRSKQQLPQLAREVGVSAPETLTISDASELYQVVQKLGLPCVVKGPHYDAEIVHSVDAAINSFNRIVAAWGGPILAQRFVRGEEYNVAAVRESASGVIGMVTMRKTVLTRQGKGWAGVTVDDPKIREFAKAVIAGLDWNGGCEVELLKDLNGGLHLVEVNPRFPAWIYLSTASGVNLPKGLVQIALGQPLDSFKNAEAGVFYVRHAAEVIGNVADLAQVVSSGRKSTPPSTLQI
jgi:carbamoyl-phosphate synthase large subunit